MLLMTRQDIVSVVQDGELVVRPEKVQDLLFVMQALELDFLTLRQRKGACL